MSLLRKLLGQEGEDQAARFLEKKGYRILERNYRSRTGEIDLIALHEGQVVFVEVKTRTNDAYGVPQLAVTPGKQRKMIKAALTYIRLKKIDQMPCRFDVVAITASSDPGVEVIEDAFEMDRTRL